MEHSFVHSLQSVGQLNNSQEFMEPKIRHFTAQGLYRFGSKFSVLHIGMDATTYNVKKAR